MHVYLVKGIKVRSFRAVAAIVKEEASSDAIRLLKNSAHFASEDIDYWFFEAFAVEYLEANDGVGIYICKFF